MRICGFVVYDFSRGQFGPAKNFIISRRRVKFLFFCMARGTRKEEIDQDWVKAEQLTVEIGSFNCRKIVDQDWINEEQLPVEIGSVIHRTFGRDWINTDDQDWIGCCRIKVLVRSLLLFTQTFDNICIDFFFFFFIFASRRIFLKSVVRRFLLVVESLSIKMPKNTHFHISF